MTPCRQANARRATARTPAQPGRQARAAVARTRATAVVGRPGVLRPWRLPGLHLCAPSLGRGHGAAQVCSLGPTTHLQPRSNNTFPLHLATPCLFSVVFGSTPPPRPWSPAPAPALPRPLRRDILCPRFLGSIRRRRSPVARHSLGSPRSSARSTWRRSPTLLHSSPPSSSSRQWFVHEGCVNLSESPKIQRNAAKFLVFQTKHCQSEHRMQVRFFLRHKSKHGKLASSCKNPKFTACV